MLRENERDSLTNTFDNGHTTNVFNAFKLSFFLRNIKKHVVTTLKTSFFLRRHSVFLAEVSKAETRLRSANPLEVLLKAFGQQQNV